MTARRYTYLLAGALAVALLWHYVLTGIALWFFYRIMRWKHGPKARPRPKSSWSSLGRTSALMLVAWNTRWVKPMLSASIPASASNEYDRPEWWDR